MLGVGMAVSRGAASGPASPRDGHQDHHPRLDVASHAASTGSGSSEKPQAASQPRQRAQNAASRPKRRGCNIFQGMQYFSEKAREALEKRLAELEGGFESAGSEEEAGIEISQNTRFMCEAGARS